MADLGKNKLFDCTGLVAVITGGGTGKPFYISLQLHCNSEEKKI